MLNNQLAKEEAATLFLTANEMLRIDHENDLYSYIAKYLADTYPDTIIVVLKTLPSEGADAHKAEPVKIEGIKSSLISQASKLLGFKIEGETFDILEENLIQWKSNKLILTEGGFVEFLKTQVNSSISKSLEKLIRLNKIYSIGLQDQDQLLAFIHLFTRKNKEIESPAFLEAFIQQASIILAQLKSRQALEKSEKKLIRLSNSLTALSNTKELNDAYDYVTNALHEAYADSLIMYTAIDEPSRSYTISSFAGLKDNQQKILNDIADYQWINKKFDMNEQRHKQLRTGKLTQLEGGLISFEGPEFTIETAEAIQKSLNIKRFYSLGMLLDGKLIGAIYIAICRDYQYPEKRFVETFAKQVATIIAIIESRHALIESEAQLRKLNINKDRFMKVLAHDLRSPFNSIMGYSNLLQKNAEKYDSNKVREIATVISKTSGKTYDLLEDILRWISASDGNLQINKEAIVLDRFLELILERLSTQAAPKNITLEPDLTKGLSISSDPDMLRTVIRNLVSNAIKFSYQGSKVIVKTESDSENHVIISVSDTGTGMTQEELNAIWDPAQKISKPGTENETGTGFGLVVCKDFINALSGEISAESRLNHGSTFRISMPNSEEK